MRGRERRYIATAAKGEAGTRTDSLVVGNSLRGPSPTYASLSNLPPRRTPRRTDECLHFLATGQRSDALAVLEVLLASDGQQPADHAVPAQDIASVQVVLAVQAPEVPGRGVRPDILRLRASRSSVDQFHASHRVPAPRPRTDTDVGLQRHSAVIGLCSWLSQQNVRV